MRKRGDNVELTLEQPFPPAPHWSLFDQARRAHIFPAYWETLGLRRVGENESPIIVVLGGFTE